MKELISVILPCYNVENYIKRGLNSILSQSYENWEAILVDDGSIDATGKICDEYAIKDSRFVVVHKKNGGVSEARNVGIDKAVGKYLYFMDPDDWIEPNCFYRCIEEFNKDNVDVVQFGRYWCWGDSKTNEDKIKYDTYTHDEIVVTYTGPMMGLNQNALNHWYKGENIWKYKKCWQVFCFMFKRSLIVDNNIRFIPKIRMFEDILFAIECTYYSNKLVAIPDILYNYDQRDDGAVLSRSRCMEKIFQDKYLLIEQRERIRAMVCEIDLFDYYFASNVLSCLELAIKLSIDFSYYSDYSKYIRHVQTRKAIDKVCLTGAPLKFKLPVTMLKYRLHTLLFFVCWCLHKLGASHKIKI